MRRVGRGLRDLPGVLGGLSEFGGGRLRSLLTRLVSSGLRVLGGLLGAACDVTGGDGGLPRVADSLLQFGNVAFRGFGDGILHRGLALFCRVVCFVCFCGRALCRFGCGVGSFLSVFGGLCRCVEPLGQLLDLFPRFGLCLFSFFDGSEGCRSGVVGGALRFVCGLSRGLQSFVGFEVCFAGGLEGFLHDGLGALGCVGRGLCSVCRGLDCVLQFCGLEQLGLLDRFVSGAPRRFGVLVRRFDRLHHLGRPLRFGGAREVDPVGGFVRIRLRCVCDLLSFFRCAFRRLGGPCRRLGGLRGGFDGLAEAGRVELLRSLRGFVRGRLCAAGRRSSVLGDLLGVPGDLGGRRCDFSGPLQLGEFELFGLLGCSLRVRVGASGGLEGFFCNLCGGARSAAGFGSRFLCGFLCGLCFLHGFRGLFVFLGGPLLGSFSGFARRELRVFGGLAGVLRFLPGFIGSLRSRRLGLFGFCGRVFGSGPRGLGRRLRCQCDVHGVFGCLAGGLGGLGESFRGLAEFVGPPRLGGRQALGLLGCFVRRLARVVGGPLRLFCDSSGRVGGGVCCGLRGLGGPLRGLCALDRLFYPAGRFGRRVGVRCLGFVGSCERLAGDGPCFFCRLYRLFRKLLGGVGRLLGGGLGRSRHFSSFGGCFESAGDVVRRSSPAFCATSWPCRFLTRRLRSHFFF